MVLELLLLLACLCCYQQERELVLVFALQTELLERWLYALARSKALTVYLHDCSMCVCV